MNAVAALLFAAFFTLAASNAINSFEADIKKAKLTFSSRRYFLQSKTVDFPPDITQFDIPDAYSSGRETVLYFQGLHKQDLNIYEQRNLTSGGYLDRCDCNVIVIYWNEVPNSDTEEDLRDAARLVGENVVDLLQFIKGKVGVGLIHVVGFEVGTMAAEAFISNSGGAFQIRHFIALDPKMLVKKMEKTYKYLTDHVNEAIQVVHSAGLHDLLGDRDYFVNDGRSTEVPCGTWSSYVAYFLAMNHEFANDLVTYCSSWDKYKSGGCANNPKIQLYNLVVRSDIDVPDGSYFFEFNYCR